MKYTEKKKNNNNNSLNYFNCLVWNRIRNIICTQLLLTEHCAWYFSTAFFVVCTLCVFFLSILTDIVKITNSVQMMIFIKHQTFSTFFGLFRVLFFFCCSKNVDHLWLYDLRLERKKNFQKKCGKWAANLLCKYVRLFGQHWVNGNEI